MFSLRCSDRKSTLCSKSLCLSHSAANRTKRIRSLPSYVRVCWSSSCRSCSKLSVCLLLEMKMISNDSPVALGRLAARKAAVGRRFNHDLALSGRLEVAEHEERCSRAKIVERERELWAHGKTKSNFEFQNKNKPCGVFLKEKHNSSSGENCLFWGQTLPATLAQCQRLLFWRLLKLQLRLLIGARSCSLPKRSLFFEE